jgi:hypothetical protein
MSTDSVEIVTDEHTGLLDSLEGLLNRQIAQVRKGNFLESEALSEQSDEIVDKLGKTSVPESIEFKEQFERLTKLYRQAMLVVAAEKDRLERQLQQVGLARKTSRVYRGHD